MAQLKAALKLINEAIRQHKFDDAIQKSREYLAKDPKSYQGHIFLAFSLDKKQRLDEAERIYDAAVTIRPQDAQAYQGLIKLYQSQGANKLIEYQRAVINVARIFYDSEDLYKAQDAVDSYVDFARAHGDSLQYADALWIRLPESPLYPILEGRFPPPAKAYETIAHIIEDYDKKRINTLIGERRTRLAAVLSHVTTQVKREVYGQSKLEHIYRQLIDWTNNDELRRCFEEKLLRYCHDRLLVCPPEAKAEQRAIVLKLAQDMVIIQHPFKLAWEIVINWQDHKEIKDWDVQLLRTYCSFFPESDMYKVITAYLTSNLSPFPPAVDAEKKMPETSWSDESEDDDDGGVPTSYLPLSDEDRLIMITEGMSGAESTFSYRLVGHFFLQLGEYETTVEQMRKARQFIAREQAVMGMQFQNTCDAYSVLLATALVYYQCPRHHEEAKSLFDGVLEHDTSCTAALIGVGLIYEEEQELDQALDFLTRAIQRDGTNLRVRCEAAWVKALRGDWQTAKEDLTDCLRLLGEERSPDKDLVAEIHYRLGTCIWNMDSSRQARKRRSGDCAYAHWLAALSSNMNHAPSYTSLGVFYSDYAKDKRRGRYSFQKALEMSSAEVLAAERLARSFAEDGDWDRVELVARRVVESGKVKPPPGSKRKGISWPLAALGVAELNKQEYHKSIVSFQSALRLSPNDYHCWVGLGESYHSSGRYMAATKAIVNAQSLEQDGQGGEAQDGWFTTYMLANIKRELGEFDEAISLYQSVLDTRADEEGVVIALLQTLVENALASLERGHFGKSVELALKAIDFACGASASVRKTFNFWKSVGDACSVFSSVQSQVQDFPKDSMRMLLESSNQEAFDVLSNVDQVDTSVVFAKGLYSQEEQVAVDLTRCVHASILCHKAAMHAAQDDVHARAVAHYNLGWAEFRAHECLPADLRMGSSKYLRASCQAFKRAIELESGNSEFWNALGVVTSDMNPSVSQHALVRSLHLNERSPVAWTNLGTVALLSGDTKLAKEAYTKAQSADPEYAHAWIGQAFIALLSGGQAEARGLLTHAMSIADASSLPTRRHYSACIFDHIAAAPPEMTVSWLVQPLLALNQVHSLRPHDFVSDHLAALLDERIGDTRHMVQRLEELCDRAQGDYESTSSAQSLAKLTVAKADLARAYLASGSNQKAVECGQAALVLSRHQGQEELGQDRRSRARLSANLTVGLGYFHVGAHDEAEECFKAALDESHGNADATCLVAQALWAQGTDESREKARECLFEIMEKQPEHMHSILLLGIMALVDQDEGSLEAVVEDLELLRATASVSAARQSQISQVLRAIAGLRQGHTEQDRLAQVQRDIMLHPYLAHGWGALAETTRSRHAAQMALVVSAQNMPPRGSIESVELAEAYARTGKAADGQRAALLAPWRPLDVTVQGQE
ncbi:hypothetical protein CDD82_6412 [Ophiocordyceps australis]|uniref:Superkiller protein 3 n=1 Tax=Ophiocordyceps australis TaxID=1399860 RepID=A0A2C5ZS96_9HYPO|nr:hypothetical protein CDD82_6412 [Ophiocordyceps australis]